MIIWFHGNDSDGKIKVQGNKLTSFDVALKIRRMMGANGRRSAIHIYVCHGNQHRLHGYFEAFRPVYYPPHKGFMCLNKAGKFQFYGGMNNNDDVNGRVIVPADGTNWMVNQAFQRTGGQQAR
ncbi:hypothetical protein BTJ40_06680 [Microbulbifer sp. A4B17]|uniref:hypothetical protein n=1 Tax=Microbulbifer sp. A4B17 TaxID=359370 RepID=UPI000D52D6CD|nr:hypothetical protein [Microbulbifer sp. A4B17]AWF80517.1 hypothetical protein BTJ40_06680 [Microbulbifer sp. A4B17]